ncbi:Phage integrase [Stutzerimonas stutzeri]|nr:Phage integrase [Stutzerimonas stutzeri]
MPLLQTGISHQFDLRGKDVVGQITEHQKLVDFFKQATALHLKRDYSLNGAETDQLQAILSDPKQYKPRSPITPSRLDSFRTHLERKGTAAKTVDQVCRRVALFSSYLGKHGHPLTFDTVSAYLDQLTDKAGNPLTAKTKKQHVWSCSLFWKFACKYDADWREQYKGQPSPFADHDLPVIKGESAPWEAFTKEDVEKLHALALEKKDQPLADLIAVGAYTGARLEEIGRIHRDNITFKDGVPISFHIEQAKTTAGEREVPIHHKIAGLVSSLLEGSKDGFLFEGGHNKYGNRLDPLSKRFGRLKTAAGYDKQFVFHSIRKTTITLMHQAGADIAVMPAVVGHETGLFSLDRYSAGPSMPQKRQVIELLSFDFP